jgi:sugar O-acyltransferase (sialic acid O-acetyltransferase NeuD family)
MKKNKKLVIVGLGETADIAYEYFTHDSQYEVVAFSVNEQFINQDFHLNLPIVPFEKLESFYNPQIFEVYVAISYVKLNRVRRKMYESCKSKGFTCANYISSKAFVWHNVVIGENVFIFENNVIQHKVNIGNNVILWSGNHVGHQTIIEDHVYIASHAVISGFCKIGTSSFVGVNTTFNDNVSIAEDTIVGSASLIVKNFLEKGQVLIGSPAKAGPRNSYKTFKVDENEMGG